MPDEELLLAITADNKLVHVGKPAGLLPHVVDEDEEAQHDPQLPVPTWEFYDSTGAPFQFVLNAAGKPVGFEPVQVLVAPTDADRQLLVDRIAASLAGLQVFLDKQIHAGAFDDDDGPPQRRVPQVTGELPDVLRALFALVPAVPGNPPHAGSFLHNLWHQVFG